MDDEEYRKKIELEILQIIEDNLKNRQIDAHRAREIAKYILSTLQPNLTLSKIFEVAQHFDDHFAELTPVVLEVTHDYDEKIRKAVVSHVESLLKQGKIDEANKILTNATTKEAS